MKRIVKETLKSGKVQYRVEKNTTFFGLIPCEWYTCTVTIPFGFGEVSCEAVFNTLEEAQKFCGVNPNPIVNREIIVNKGL